MKKKLYLAIANSDILDGTCSMRELHDMYLVEYSSHHEAINTRKDLLEAFAEGNTKAFIANVNTREKDIVALLKKLRFKKVFTYKGNNGKVVTMMTQLSPAERK